MSLRDTIVQAWYMLCNVCGEKSKHYLTTEEAMKEIRASGWISRSYFKNTLACEDWYCPKCADKATETRDTIPAPPPIEEPK